MGQRFLDSAQFWCTQFLYGLPDHCGWVWCTLWLVYTITNTATCGVCLLHQNHIWDFFQSERVWGNTDWLQQRGWGVQEERGGQPWRNAEKRWEAGWARQTSQRRSRRIRGKRCECWSRNLNFTSYFYKVTNTHVIAIILLFSCMMYRVATNIIELDSVIFTNSCFEITLFWWCAIILENLKNI